MTTTTPPDDDPPLYGTRAFAERFVDQLNQDAGFQQAARRFRDAFVIRILDRPDGMDVTCTYRIDRGRASLEDFREAPSPAPFRGEPFDKKRALARSTAPYAVWVRLDRGDMSPVAALASPEYTIEGSKLKIMAQIGVVNALNAVAGRTPKRYA
jgi:hypothetical protein